MIRAVDWPALFDQLGSAGVSVLHVAAATGIPVSTMRIYAGGVSHPAHWRGERLLELWCRTLRKRREQVPMTAVYLAPRVCGTRARPGKDSAADLKKPDVAKARPLDKTSLFPCAS